MANTIIQEKQEMLAELCRLYHVRRLEAFGSILRDDFNIKHSDIDLLLELDDHGVKNYADCYFGFKEALEALFDRKVDLVLVSAIKNPFFLESINKNRSLLYAA